MAEMGYVLSSEEMSPNEIVRNARRAEEAGFTTAWISDHYHPWIDAQGQSPFVWSVIGQAVPPEFWRGLVLFALPNSLFRVCAFQQRAAQVHCLWRATCSCVSPCGKATGQEDPRPSRKVQLMRCVTRPNG
jgi:hypothetical protein